jgi:putative YhdH/YhfP family quinone oxidoreductase
VALAFTPRSKVNDPPILGRALLLSLEGGKTQARVVPQPPPPLDPGELLVRVHYSAVNYKDALALRGRGRILRRSPLVGGIDAAGVVVLSRAPGWLPGTPVVAAGGGLGEERDGGYADYVRAPAALWTRLPEGLSTRSAAALGSAGLTAALALMRLEEAGLRPGDGDVLVTGASGGVGSFAVDILSRLGYRVVALSGRKDMRGYLETLGAVEMLSPPRDHEAPTGLASARWAAAIDNVGGAVLAWVLERVRRRGKVVAIGMASGSTVTLSVFPFILRQVDLLGVNSTEIEPERRATLWSRLAGPWRPPHLDVVAARTVDFDDLLQAADDVLERRHQGRIVVRLGHGEEDPAC